MTTAFAKLNPLLILLVGFFAAFGVLSVTQGHPAQAQSPGVNLAALVAKVTTLQSQVGTLQSQVGALQSQVATAQSQLNADRLRSLIVYPDGTHPFNSNVTITHTGVGQYHVVFPAGTFNSFGVPVLTAYGAAGSLSDISSPGDGSVTFDVALSADAFFDLQVISVN